MFSSGGVFDVMYILPLLVGMRLWKAKAYRPAALAVGAAFSVKQMPWLIGPFVAIWLLKECDTLTTFRRQAQKSLTYGFAGFLLPNLIFLTHPISWLKGVVTPVAGGAPLTMQGITLSAIPTHDILYLPRQYFIMMAFIVYLSSIVLYYMWYENVKWVSFVLPSVILFFHYRSLLNYYIYTPIVACYAILLRRNLVVDRNVYRLQFWTNKLKL